mgnify:CR=1 FL=1
MFRVWVNLSGEVSPNPLGAGHFQIQLDYGTDDPSDDGTTFKEHGFSFTNSEPFTAFALKIVLTGTSSCYPPRVKDMRGIALAV